ncbi:hypothetical protein NE237_032919 [Protea cynaroides]|uniref:BZIP domain-containing protein n=1 Tax=Protea cynaroides TaxID=273540 RepID=A0A9Q0L485_9MAGN|nr:hypothetical protein NE237_032919 [Protea cynaroides]
MIDLENQFKSFAFSWFLSFIFEVAERMKVTMAGRNNVVGLPPRCPKPVGSNSMMNQMNQNQSSPSSTTGLKMATSSDNDLYSSFGKFGLNGLSSGNISTMGGADATTQGVVGVGDQYYCNGKIGDMKLSDDNDDVDDDEDDDVKVNPSTTPVDLKLKNIENPPFSPSLSGTEVGAMSGANNSMNTDDDSKFYRYKWTRENEANNIDPKRMKRILANRLSAQKYRLRKIEYIAELERTVAALQADISLLSPQVARYDRQLSELIIENSSIKQRIATVANLKQFKEAEAVMLTEERDWLRDLLGRQQQILLQVQQPSSVAMQPAVIQWPDNATTDPMA